MLIVLLCLWLLAGLVASIMLFIMLNETEDLKQVFVLKVLFLVGTFLLGFISLYKVVNSVLNVLIEAAEEGF